MKVDQTELLKVLRSVLDSFDCSNAFLRQNIPILIDGNQTHQNEIAEIKETLPKHSDSITAINKNIESLFENISNEDERVTNLNKLVTNLFNQVYDMEGRQGEVGNAMSKILELQHVTEDVQAKTKELELEMHNEHQELSRFSTVIEN